jgi:hypothetical protein
MSNYSPVQMCLCGTEGNSSCSYAEIWHHEDAWDRRNRSTHYERGHYLEQIVQLHDQDSLPPEKDHALGRQLDGLLWTQRGRYKVLHTLEIFESRTSGP